MSTKPTPEKDIAMRALTELDIQTAAQALGCDPAAIKAVCEVEAPRGGFIPGDGRPTILFERHKFHQFTQGRFADAIPDLSSPRRGGYQGGAKEWDRFERAAAYDRRAAQMACSWGRFQIMGFNFAHCGFASIEEFVSAMHESEGRQLMAFVELVESFGLADELARQDWSGFAFGYNGPKYRENRYDEKLATAFRRYSTRPGLTLPEEEPEARPAGRASGPIREAHGSPALPDRSQALPGPAIDPPAKVTQNGRKAWGTHVLSWLTGGAGAVIAFFEKNEKLLYLAAAVILVGLAGWLVRGIVLDYARLKINADPEKYNVK